MSKNLLKLEEAANLSGIGHFNVVQTAPTSSSTTTKPRMTRKAKRQRVSVLEEELSKLITVSNTDDNDNDNDNTGGEAAKQTLENIYELAKMSASLDNNFFKDFHQINGIDRLLTFLNSKNNNDKNKRKNYLRSPKCVSIAAKLTYLCIMRGPTAKQTSDAFVENNGVHIFLEANSNFILNDDDDDDDDDDDNIKKNNNDDGDDSVDRFEASSDIWYALGMIFSKSGKEMDHELHMSSIDSILSSMDKLGLITTATQAKKEKYQGDDNNNNVSGKTKKETKAHKIDSATMLSRTQSKKII